MSSRKKHFAVTVVSSILVLGIAAFLHYESSRVLPEGTYLGDISLEGLNRTQASPIVQKEVERFQDMVFRIQIEDKLSKDFSSQQLGIRFDPEQTLTRVFDCTSWLVLAFASATHEDSNPFKPVANVDSATMTAALDEYLLAQERDYTDAAIVWKDQQWLIEEAVPGSILKSGERERIRDSIVAATYPFQEIVEISAEFEEVAPRLLAQDIDELYQGLHHIAREPIEVVYDRDTKIINFHEEPDWLSINPYEKTIDLNNDHAQEWIETFVAEYDRQAGQVSISSIEEQVSEYDGKIIKKAVYEGDFNKGRVSNSAKLLRDLETRISDPESERSIAIEWQQIDPQVVSHVPEYQFPQIISTGVSSYRQGNHPNRIKNIKLSLGSFQGVVIDAGEEISFNRVTGWITPRKGYTKTKIISEGRVEEGVGGGVCQSSTTVYRSILNAGLPVTERRNHTLDVSYYHAYGYGLDATVYTDARSDLRFVNDFPGPLLVNVYTDDYMQEAHVEFFGTTDHRTVELTSLYTGNYLLKKWEWKIVWPEKEEVRYVVSRYQVPKPEEEEEEESNPLEA